LVLNRAYLADDHLLAVQNSGFVESYRRIYFRDLEAFSIHWNNRRAIQGVIAGSVVALFSLLTVAFWPGRAVDAVVGSVVMGLFALVAAAVFIVNHALGPTCTCFVRTAVQTVELASITRVRRAMKVRATILERVRAFQEEVSGAVEVAGGGQAARPTSEVRIVGSVPPPKPRSTKAAAAALGANAIAGFLAAAGVLCDHVEPSAWGTAAMVVGVVAALAAGIVQSILGRGGALPKAARIAGFGMPAAMVLGIAAGYVCMFVLLLDNPAAARAQPGSFDPLRFVGRVAPGHSRVVDVCYWAMTAIYLGLGLWAGAVWAAMERGQGRDAAERRSLV
jgi:hypothetical protein